MTIIRIYILQNYYANVNKLRCNFGPIFKDIFAVYNMLWWVILHIQFWRNATAPHTQHRRAGACSCRENASLPRGRWIFASAKDRGLLTNSNSSTQLRKGLLLNPPVLASPIQPPLRQGGLFLQKITLREGMEPLPYDIYRDALPRTTKKQLPGIFPAVDSLLLFTLCIHRR